MSFVCILRLIMHRPTDRPGDWNCIKGKMKLIVFVQALLIFASVSSSAIMGPRSSAQSCNIVNLAQTHKCLLCLKVPLPLFHQTHCPASMALFLGWGHAWAGSWGWKTDLHVAQPTSSWQCKDMTCPKWILMLCWPSCLSAAMSFSICEQPLTDLQDRGIFLLQHKCSQGFVNFSPH